MSGSVRALSWNVGRRTERQVQQYVAQCAPDVVCLQETRQNPPALPGYTIAARTDGAYAGVALYVSSKCVHAPSAHAEVWIPGRVTVCELGDVLYVGVYARNDVFRRGASLARERDDAELEKRLRERIGRRVVVIGDLNLCLEFGDHHSHVGKAFDPARPASRKVTRWKRMLETLSLRDVGGAGSPWTFRGRHKGGGRYDYVFVSPGVACSDYKVHSDCTQTDHFPLHVTIK